MILKYPLPVQVAPIDTTNLNAIIQLGAIGVLLLLGIALVLYIARRPNNTPVDPTAGSNTAIFALAEAMTEGVKATNAANARLDAMLSAQKEKETADRAQDKEQNERYIESISAQADATNGLVDVLKKQGLDNSSIKDDIRMMSTQGSKPLNDLIVKFDGLQADVQAMRATSEGDHQAFELLLHDIAEMKAIVIRIDQRRSTSEINKVELSIAAPLPINGES